MMKSKARTLPVKLVRNYRPEGHSTRKEDAGSEIELPAEEARRVIEAGIAVRNDPLPA